MKLVSFPVRAAFFVVAFAVIQLGISGQTCAQTDKATLDAVEPVWVGIDREGMDRSVNPTEDFDRFANGKWYDTNPIPSDRSTWGLIDIVEERNVAMLHTILEAAAKNNKAKAGGPERKIGDFYASGMDTTRIEREGVAPLKADLDQIDHLKDVRGLQETLAHLHRTIGNPAFNSFGETHPADPNQTIFWIGEGGLGLPDRDYYFDSDAKMQTIRAEYIAHVARMFALLGETQDEAKRHAQTVMALEIRLAKDAQDKVARRDPYASLHIMTQKELDALTPGVPWQPYLKAVGLKKATPINVTTPAQVREIGRMIIGVPLNDWKPYLRWHLVHSAASYLSEAFVRENFRFYSATLRGVSEMRPRWKRVLTVVDNSMGEALGQLYVAQAFPPEAKAKATALVENLKAALRERLSASEWMSPATRQQALRKVDRLLVKVGYPDKWRDYSRLNLSRDSYLDNVRRSAAFEYQRWLDKIGKPVDRSEWGMTPPTVNAYYNPLINEIVFPAGILQPPLFSAAQDAAANYGDTGATIGHEITHGFDDQGRKYDAGGNLKEWWTGEDAKNFEARAALIEKQYGDYIAVDTLKVNGALTLGENIADIGGLRIAYLAFQKAQKEKPQSALIDDFTPEQRFFIAFAQSWRMKQRAEDMRLQVTTNEHAPERFRILGPVSLMPEFYTAFGVPVPDWVTARQKQAIW